MTVVGKLAIGLLLMAEMYAVMSLHDKWKLLLYK